MCQKKKKKEGKKIIEGNRRKKEIDQLPEFKFIYGEKDFQNHLLIKYVQEAVFQQKELCNFFTSDF